MNKRIHEITVQALENSLFESIEPTVTVGEGENKVTIPLVFAEKFAELIVKECAGIYSKIDNGNLHMGTDDYLEALHKTFRS
jgi:hypothetical protein